MAEWVYEAGIGENRAALIADGTIVEARIERLTDEPRLGAIVAARFVGGSASKGRGMVRLEGSGITAMLNDLPQQVSEGALLRVEVVREAIPERGNPKPPKVRLAAPDDPERAGPSLLEQISTNGPPVRLEPHQPDSLEDAGWSECLAEGVSGVLPFVGGLLRLVLTPAMAVIDVDGDLPPAELSRAGAREAAKAVLRLDIGGPIGIDLPLPRDAPKALRQSLAEEVDQILPQPFERTAVNGFGFLQIIRRRERASLPELLQADPALAEALALLRQAERSKGTGQRTLCAAPSVIARLGQREDWLDRLASQVGAAIALREIPGAHISGGYVEADHP